MGNLMMKVLYGVKVEPLASEKECGDQYCVKEVEHSTLIAVADGLGHGEEAAFAAKTAMHIIQTHANKPLKKMIEICHEALLITRGAALMVVKIKHHEISWAGIGNVMVAHYHPDLLSKNNSPFLLFSQPGIVGYNLPAIHVSTFKADIDDILIFFTDGILEKFIPSFVINHHSSPQHIAESIFKNYRNTNDDSLVLVSRLT
jgi:negative regulator of sigma-B (phosphoserine phosphatase)